MDLFVRLLDESCIKILLDEHDDYEDVLRKINEQCDHNYTIHNIHENYLKIVPQHIDEELKLQVGYELIIEDLKDRKLWDIESFTNCKDLSLLPVYLTEFDINIVNKNENSILIKSTTRNDIEMVKELLKFSNIDINLQNRSDYTALIQACRKNHEKIALLLLDCDNIELNIQNIWGRTALMYIIYNSNLTLIERISQYKHVNPYLKDEKCKNAFDWTEYANYEVSEELYETIKYNYKQYLIDEDEKTIIHFNIPDIGEFTTNKLLLMNMFKTQNNIEIPFNKSKVMVHSYKEE